METESNRLEEVAAPLVCLSPASQLANAPIPCGRARDAACTLPVMQHQDLTEQPTCQNFFGLHASSAVCNIP